MNKIIILIFSATLILSCSESKKNNSNSSQEKTINSDSTKNEKSPYTTIRSKNNQQETIALLKLEMSSNDFSVFSEITHTETEANSKSELPSSHLINFGNSKTFKELIECDEKIGIELPLKFLVSTNSKGVTTITYESPTTFNDNFRLNKCRKILNKLNKQMRIISSKATKKQSDKNGDKDSAKMN